MPPFPPIPPPVVEDIVLEATEDIIEGIMDAWPPWGGDEPEETADELELKEKKKAERMKASPGWVEVPMSPTIDGW